MPSLDAALKTYETLAALHALPDKTALTTAEAALFLRLSPKTMERMRLDGSGPPYIQGGAVGARGGNQKCLYFKEDLLAWQKANQISNAMQAAVRRGKAFKTIFDLIAEEPFYVDAVGLIAGAAEYVPLSVVIERLGADWWELVWMPSIDAAARKWQSSSDHHAFAGEVVATLGVTKEMIKAATDASELYASAKLMGGSD